MEDWKRRKGLPPETRVFSMHGAFPGIRKALQARGWVENEEPGSTLWDFKYALWQRDIGELSDLDPSQVVNYFARNSEVTSKAGLCNTLYNCCTLDRVDVDTFYPRCYDLNNPAQVEALVDDFKLTTALCLLKRFVADGGRTAEGGAAAAFPRSAVSTALAVCTRRSLDADDTIDEPICKAVEDQEWEVLERWSLKTPGRTLKPWGKQRAGQQAPAAPSGPAAAPPQGRQQPRPNATGVGQETAEVAGGSDASDDEGGPEVVPGSAKNGVEVRRDPADQALFLEASAVLEQLKKRLPQFDLDGLQNIWVLKPAGKSRGRGIQLTARLERILDVGVGRGAEARWIAQKYIEHPLIVGGKKFDMRQWVVVTRWMPLSVWFYNDCYCRFSMADYDPSKLKNKFSHLTNNSISKHADDFEERCDETMWHSDDLAAHLASLGFVRDGKKVEDPWEEIVHPAMKRVVYQSLESAQDSVLHRTNSFELFGYDFMIAEDLTVWLIEVNSSPDLSYSTSTTRVLVKAMLEDLVRVVFDVEKFGLQADRPRRKWNTCRLNTGRYELLEPGRRRREEKFPKIKKDAAQLAVQGASLKLRRPRKGECVAAADAETDPRYDAVALLAAAREAGVEEGEPERRGAAEDGEDEDAESDQEEGDDLA